MGFSKNEFPPEKAIYLSLLKNTGMHAYNEKIKSYSLLPPSEKNSFYKLWEKCEKFLKTTKNSKKGLHELINIISMPPFKLKNGFIEFWLPLYLFIKKNDYALFDESQYIPSLSSETFDLILKNPDKFEIKAFNIDGLKLELFNKYRSILKMDQHNEISNISFIDTIRPFLTFYNGLPEYAKKTKKISKQAIILREAIATAKDPETSFFETFPSALGFTIDSLRKSENNLKKYIKKFRTSIREIRSCFDELLDKIELQLLEILGYNDLLFQEYNLLIRKRYQNIKKYLLLPMQKTFYMRLYSQNDDKASWFNSIIQAIMGKNIENFLDDDELILYEKLENVFQELDNMCEIVKHGQIKENTYKIELTSLSKGLKKQIINIPENKNKDIAQLKKKIVESLSKNDRLNIIVLIGILQERMKGE